MSTPKVESHDCRLTLLNKPSLPVDFVPWQRDERGQQVYIKLSRGEETSLLFVGENCQLDAELQQILMRLVNEGWNVEGEVTVAFEGRNEPETDPYVYQDAITVELGAALLPLVDPQKQALLSTNLPSVRDSVAKALGLVPTGVRIKDNLQLGANQYVILLKNSPIGAGELFLDRYLATGTHEQISDFPGWNTLDPLYHQPAKWITADFRDKADALGCAVMGSLQVIMHHLQRVMLDFSPELLGLQETYNLISRLQITHPVVIEDFLHDRSKLRRLHKVLQALLSEQVAIKDLVTILEVVGEALEDTISIEEIVERCRQHLARQICWNYLNKDGELQALMLSDNIESTLTEVVDGDDTELSEELRKKLIKAIEEAWMTHHRPLVLFTAPPLRPLVSQLLRRALPQIHVLSTAELVSGIKLIVNATVDINAPNPDKLGDTPPSAGSDAAKAEAIPEAESATETTKKSRGIIDNIFGRK